MSYFELDMGNIEAMFADPTGPVGIIIEDKTVEVEVVAKALLTLPGAGKEYGPGTIAFRSGGKFYTNWPLHRFGMHRASAPGEPPANDPGNPAHPLFLTATLGHKIGVERTVYGIVGSPLEYARYLELGTSRPGKGTRPRPFLVPALEIVVGPAVEDVG